MAARLSQRVIDLPATVKSSHRLLLLVLVNYADRDGGNIFPSVETIAKAMGYCERQVRRLLAQVTAAGLLAEVAPPRQHQSRVYRLTLDQPKRTVRQDIAMSTLASPCETNPKPSEWTSETARVDISNVRADTAMSTDLSTDLLGSKNGGAQAPPPSPEINYSVLKKLAVEVVAANPGDGFPDLLEGAKARAASLHVAYDRRIAGAVTFALKDRQQREAGQREQPRRRRR